MVHYLVPIMHRKIRFFCFLCFLPALVLCAVCVYPFHCQHRMQEMQIIDATHINGLNEEMQIGITEATHMTIQQPTDSL